MFPIGEVDSFRVERFRLRSPWLNSVAYRLSGAADTAVSQLSTRRFLPLFKAYAASLCFVASLLLFLSSAGYGQQPPPANQTTEPRIALLIGVGDYRGTRFPSLPGIDKDLERMDQALRAAGFKTTPLLNPSLSKAEDAIEAFGAELKTQKGGVGLFYFSGHGGEFEGRNYLVPKGARIGNIRDLKDQALAAQRVLNRMEDAKARVNLVFLDCCRNDLTKAATDTGLAPMSARGTFIGFATAEDKTSAASEEGSPYTTFLAQRLLTPGVSILDMHTQVTADVEDFTEKGGAKQTPFQYSGLRSNFSFVPNSQQIRLPTTGQSPRSQTLEEVQSLLRKALSLRNGHLNLQVIDTCTAALALESDLPLALALRGDAYRDQDDMGRAKKDWQRAVDAAATDAMDFYGRGKACDALDLFERAAADFDEAIKLNPMFALAYNGRGKVYNELKQYDRAIADLSRAIMLDPKLAFAYGNRGVVYNELKQYDRAIADLSRAIILDSKLAYAYAYRGSVYNELKQYDRAIADCTKVIEFEPKNSMAYRERANGYYEINRYDRAVTDYTKAIELDPEDAEAYSNRGLAYKQLKQYDLAIADYTKAIELDPKYAPTYRKRGAVYKTLGKDSRATRDFNKAKELEEKDD